VQGQSFAVSTQSRVSGRGTLEGGDMAGQYRDIFEKAFDDLGFDAEDATDTIASDIDGSDELDSDSDGLEEDELVGDLEESEQAEEDGDDGEVDLGDNKPNTGNVIALSDNQKVVLPDGTEVDAKDIIAFQSDYTKKTQALAEQRKQFDTEREQIVTAYNQMRDYYEDRVKDPTNWVTEIASQAEKPTAVVAGAIYDLAQQGLLDKEFVELFGIDSGLIANTAKESKTDSELRALREKMERRELEEQERERMQQTVARYQSEWSQIKQDHNLSFDTPDAETAAKRELLTFATERKLTASLVDAYDLLAARKARQSPPEVKATTAKPEPDPATLEKKRASRAVAQRSSSGGAAPAKKARPTTTRSAALEVLEEYAARGR
jgi:hypothetical protein